MAEKKGRAWSSEMQGEVIGGRAGSLSLTRACLLDNLAGFLLCLQELLNAFRVCSLAKCV